MIKTFNWDEEISIHNVKRFEQFIQQILTSNSLGIILNLEHVSFMNSSALGIIANAVLRTKELNKIIVIINNKASMKKIFDIVSFASIINIFTSEQEARQYVTDILLKQKAELEQHTLSAAKIV